MYLLYQCVCVKPIIGRARKIVQQKKTSSKATGFPGQEDTFQTTIEKFFSWVSHKIEHKKSLANATQPAPHRTDDL